MLVTVTQGYQEITNGVMDQAEDAHVEAPQAETRFGGFSPRILLNAGQGWEEHHGHTPTAWAKLTIQALPTPAGCTVTAHGTGTQSGEASGRLKLLGTTTSTLIGHPMNALPYRS